MLCGLFLTFALDDLPIYLDAGSPNTGIPKSYACGLTEMNPPKIETQAGCPYGALLMFG
jgi:hypothetical protein